jgi:hypothetical protein
LSSRCGTSTLCREDARCRQAYDLPALIERAVALFDAGPIVAVRPGS